MNPMTNQENAVPVTINRKRLVPWIIFLIFFGVLNETVFNVSTPKIAAQYGLLPSQVSWVITVFIITFGLGSVIYGKLSDIYSIRRLIFIGIGIYNVGSLIGITMQAWYPAVIIGRAIQGAGASSIPALIMIVVARYFSPAERGKLFGLLTSTVSFAVGVGPVVGGFISASMHWSYLFFVSFFALIAVPFIRRELPPEEGGKGKLDIWGSILMGTTITTLILYLTNPHLLLIVISVAALIWFVYHIRRTPSPFVEPQLFVQRTYRNGLVIGFVIFGSVMAIMFIVPLMLSQLHGLSTDTIGIVMFPGAFSAVLFGPIAGKMTVKKGSHFVVYIGLALISLSLLFLAATSESSVIFIAATLILMYIGFSFLQTSLAESITRILPIEQIGVGMGFYNLVSFISGAVGTALVARVMDQRLFSVPLLPTVSDPLAAMFSNLMLFLTLTVLISGWLYFVTFSANKAEVLRREF